MLIPDRFAQAYQKVKDLQNQDRYVSAFIFGSFVRGETTTRSDLDVMVVVKDDQTCSEVNHPFVNGVKLDISFNSFEDIKKRSEEEIKKLERVPTLAESIIVFDKNGQLTKLRQQAQKAKPKKFLKKNQPWIQFMMYHTNDKVERFLEENPTISLFTMSTGIQEVLKTHYQIQRKWWVSNKRMLQDINNWDPKLAKLIEKFVSTSNVMEKYGFWSKIIDHVLKPLGGRQPISENNCNCKICKKDLAFLI